MDDLIKDDLIPVDTSSGMFSTEYAVSLNTANNQQVSFFVDKTLIEKRGEESFLKVKSYSNNECGGKKKIFLPTETIETDSRWIEISGDI